MGIYRIRSINFPDLCEAIGECLSLSWQNGVDWIPSSEKNDASTFPVESTLGKFVDGSDQKVSATEVSTLPEPFLFRICFV